MATKVEFFYEPQVRVVQRPQLDLETVEWLLRTQYGLSGGVAFPAEPVKVPGAALTLHGGSTAEYACEVAGRMCYSAFGDAQGRVGSAAYFGNILRSGHGSLLELSSWTLVVCRASRGYLAQQTRHRAGWGYAAESTHYVDYSRTPARVCLTGMPPEARPTAEAAAAAAVDSYCKLRAELEADSSIETKKDRSAQARQLLPTGLECRLMLSANARALRHFLELRGHRSNVPEIRCVASAVLGLMRTEAPVLFGDFEELTGDDGFPVLGCRYRKV